MAEHPKKQSHKAITVSVNTKKNWKTILKEVEKNELPIDVLQYIDVHLIDGTQLSIDVKKLLDNGNDPFEVESLLDAKFKDLDEYIENVDFFIDVDKVVNMVSPATEKVLKNI